MFSLKPHNLSEAKYYSKNETYIKVVTMKISPKIFLQITSLISSDQFKMRKTEFGILHGSEFFLFTL